MGRVVALTTVHELGLVVDLQLAVLVLVVAQVDGALSTLGDELLLLLVALGLNHLGCSLFNVCSMSYVVVLCLYAPRLECTRSNGSSSVSILYSTLRALVLLTPQCC
jgi:Na+/serine symporter